MSKIQEIDAIILDADGTLLNSLQRQHDWFFHYWREIHGDKSWPFTTVAEFVEEYNHTLDTGGYPKGVQTFYDRLGLPCDMNDLPDEKIGKPGHIVWPKYTAYKDAHPSGLYPQMKETLAQIYALGNLTADPTNFRRLRMALNTNNTWKG